MKKGFLKKYIHTVSLAFILLVFLFSTKQTVNAQCINAFPHVEDFETTPTWTAFTAPTSSVAATGDWAWGTPNHTYVIQSAGSGSKCWCVGTLTGSFYNYNQESYVQSPCYDFTNLQYPHIKFKLFYDSEYKYDGANLQSSIDGGVTWQDVGTVGGTTTNPIPEATDCNTQNWYNYPSILYLNSPAGFVTSKHGWCGNVEAGGTGWDATHPAVSCVGGNGIGHWVTAEHCLTGLAGQANVLLRFTFGGGFTCNDFDGFAFDSVAVSNGIINTTTITTTCGAGNSINFNSGTAACPTTTWAWNFGDATSGGSNTSTIQNPSHTFSGVGNYTVTLIASGGICNPPDTVTKIINVMAASVTSFSNVTCAALGSATVTVTGGTAPMYSWLPSGGTSNTANGLSASTYTVFVTGANSCPANATVTITSPIQPTVTATSSPVSCISAGSATATVNGGMAPYNYTWLPSGGNLATASNLSVGNYTVLVSDVNSCTTTASVAVTNVGGGLTTTISSTSVSCNGGNNGSSTVVALSGTAPYNYTWSPSGGNLATANNLNAGSYTVLVSDVNSCTATATAIIAQPLAISLTTTSHSVTCNGLSNGSATVTATGGMPTYTYLWLPNGGNNSTVNGLSAASYTVLVLDNNLCKDSATVIINQPTIIMVAATSTATTCGLLNGIASAINVSGGTPNYTYAWLPAGGNNAVAINLASGNYTLTVTDANNCIITAQTTIAASTPAPLINFSENPGFGCVPVCALFSAVAAPVANDTISAWIWNFSDGSAAETGNNPYHCFTVSGSYNVQLIAIDQNGCSDTLRKNNVINVYPKPIANFYASPWETDVFSPTINFYDESQSNITNWNWTLLSGVTSTVQNPEYTYQNEGTYPVTLIVTNLSGCKDTITRDVKIDPIFTFYAPNCTTPNDDGINDSFLPVGTGWDNNNYNLWIFDRWGNLFFHTTNPTQGWDGTRYNSKVQEDTYVWKVELKDIVFEKDHSYHGQVSVVR